MKISFGFPTCRPQCQLDWFMDALVEQTKEIGFDLGSSELVVVDSVLWTDAARRDEIKDIVNGRIPLVHVPPKPNPWHGPNRLTVKEYAAHGSARNTIFCHTSGDHLISVDDCSVLMPSWLKAHLEGATEGKLVAGLYPKHKNVSVQAGRITESEAWPGYVDNRGDLGPRYVGGGWFFTGNVGIPMTVALKLNGFEEILDAIGSEDCDFGVRADNAGHHTWIEPRAVTIQAQDRKHAQNDRAVSYHRARPWDDDLAAYQSNLHGRTWTAGNAFSLSDLRREILGGGSYPAPSWFPDDHWAKRIEGL